jgi:methionyl-tRNA synthetase
VEALPGALEGALARFALDEALAAVFEVVAATNRAIERTAPWALPRERVGVVLFPLVEAVRIAGLALAPFLPGTSARIGQQLGQVPPRESWWAGLRWGAVPWEAAVPGGEVLFAKT